MCYRQSGVSLDQDDPRQQRRTEPQNPKKGNVGKRGSLPLKAQTNNQKNTIFLMALGAQGPISAEIIAFFDRNCWAGAPKNLFFFWGPHAKCLKHREKLDSRQKMPRPIRDDRGKFLPKNASKHGEKSGFSRKKCAWKTACLQKLIVGKLIRKSCKSACNNSGSDGTLSATPKTCNGSRIH